MNKNNCFEINIFNSWRLKEIILYNKLNMINFHWQEK